jgi:hypothetical protein
MLRGCVGRGTVDIVYLLVMIAFLLLTLALVAGCAALERKK